MTNPDPCANCHFLPDPVAKCKARACPFADQREEAAEDKEREEEDDVVAWRMGDDQAAHGALKALVGLCGPSRGDAVPTRTEPVRWSRGGGRGVPILPTLIQKTGWSLADARAQIRAGGGGGGLLDGKGEGEGDE